MSVKYCRTCGAENSAFACYCTECGKNDFSSTDAYSVRAESFGCGSELKYYVMDKVRSANEEAILAEKLFKFTERNDGTYSLSGLNNTPLPKELVLPVSHRGMKVVKIDDGAFRFCHGVEHIEVPEGIVSIGRSAFAGCEDLESVTVSASVREMDGNPFGQLDLDKITISEDNETFKKIEGCIVNVSTRSLVASRKGHIPNGIVGILSSAFGMNVSVERVDICESVRYIENNPFMGVKMQDVHVAQDNMYLRKVNNCLIENETNMLISGDETSSISYSVTSIGPFAFGRRLKLKRLRIPKTLRAICDCAFILCPFLKDIDYEGSIEEWKRMKREPMWCRPHMRITIHCSDGDIENE